MIDPKNTASDVWADTAYRPKANEDFLQRVGSCINQKKPKGKPMSEQARRANARKSKIRGRHHARHHGLEHEAMELAQQAKCARVTEKPTKTMEYSLSRLAKGAEISAQAPKRDKTAAIKTFPDA